MTRLSLPGYRKVAPADDPIYARDDLFGEAADLFWEQRDGEHEFVEVALDDLLFSQPTIDPERVQWIVEHSEVIDGDLPDGADDTMYAHSTVMRWRNEYWLYDGHHRVAAAQQLGRSTMRFALVDLDALVLMNNEQ